MYETIRNGLVFSENPLSCEMMNGLDISDLSEAKLNEYYEKAIGFPIDEHKIRAYRIVNINVNTDQQYSTPASLIKKLNMKARAVPKEYLGIPFLLIYMEIEKWPKKLWSAK
eukprot:Pgem_evm2s3984